MAPNLDPRLLPFSTDEGSPLFFYLLILEKESPASEVVFYFVLFSFLNMVC